MTDERTDEQIFVNVESLSRLIINSNIHMCCDLSDVTCVVSDQRWQQCQPQHPQFTTIIHILSLVPTRP